MASRRLSRCAMKMAAMASAVLLCLFDAFHVSAQQASSSEWHTDVGVWTLAGAFAASDVNVQTPTVTRVVVFLANALGVMLVCSLYRHGWSGSSAMLTPLLDELDGGAVGPLGSVRAEPDAGTDQVIRLAALCKMLRSRKTAAVAILVLLCPCAIVLLEKEEAHRLRDLTMFVMALAVAVFLVIFFVVKPRLTPKAYAPAMGLNRNGLDEVEWREHAIRTYRTDWAARAADLGDDAVQDMERLKAMLFSLEWVKMMMVVGERFSFLYDVGSDAKVASEFHAKGHPTWGKFCITCLAFPYILLTIILRQVATTRIKKRLKVNGIMSNIIWFTLSGPILICIDLYNTFRYFVSHPEDPETFHYMNLRKMSEFSESLPQLALQGYIFLRLANPFGLMEPLSGFNINPFLLASSVGMSAYGVYKNVTFVQKFATRQAGGNKIKFLKLMCRLGEGLAPSTVFVALETTAHVTITAPLGAISRAEVRAIGKTASGSRVLRSLKIENVDFMERLYKQYGGKPVEVTNFVSSLMYAPKLESLSLGSRRAPLPAWFETEDCIKELENRPYLLQVEFWVRGEQGVYLATRKNTLLSGLRLESSLVRAAAVGDAYRVARFADYGQRDLPMGRAVRHAALRGNVEAFRELLLLPGGMKAAGDHEVAIIAAQWDRIDVMGLLLCAHPLAHELQDSNGVCALRKAAGLNSAHVVELLIAVGADLHQADNSGGTPLIMATQYNAARPVKALLKAKADVHQARGGGVAAIHQAAQDNLVEVLRPLLKDGADVNQVGVDGATPTMYAARENSVDALRVLLKARGDPNKALTTTNATPTFIAAQNGYVETLGLLLSAGAVVNQAKFDGSTPVASATFAGACVEVLRLMLKKRADVNKANSNGATPMFWAARQNHIEASRVLLEARADASKANNDGVTPLLIATEKNHCDMVKVLLQARSDVNKEDSAGATPLYRAAQNNNLKALRLFLEAGPDVNQAHRDGSTPLFMATMQNSPEMLWELLRARADVDQAAAANGCTPAHLAAQNNCAEALRFLLDARADTNKAHHQRGTTPVFLATLNNNLQSMQDLLRARADVNKAAADGCTPTFLAVRQNTVDALRLLLDARADTNKAHSDGTTPVFMATVNNNPEMLQELLRARADVDQAIANGSTPTFFAAKQNYADALRLLLDARADTNKAYPDGTTPAFMATVNNNPVILQELLRARADVDQAAADGCTPTFFAAKQNYADAMRLLLDARADANKAYPDGTTPVFMATVNNNPEMLQELLRARADVDQAAADGCTPTFLATKQNYADALRLLLDARADTNKADLEGSAPLFYAVSAAQQSVDVVRMLMGAGADINQAHEKSGASPVFIATVQNCLSSLGLLLKARADATKAAHDGCTAINFAAQNNRIDALRLLLGARVDPNEVGSDGSTPLSIAQANGFDEVVALLQGAP